MEKAFAILEITIMVDIQCLLVGMGLFFEICFQETSLSSGWPRLDIIEAAALSLKARLLLGRVLTLRPAYMHVAELSGKRGRSGCAITSKHRDRCDTVQCVALKSPTGSMRLPHDNLDSNGMAMTGT